MSEKKGNRIYNVEEYRSMKTDPMKLIIELVDKDVNQLLQISSICSRR